MWSVFKPTLAIKEEKNTAKFNLHSKNSNAMKVNKLTICFPFKTLKDKTKRETIILRFNISNKLFTCIQQHVLY